jgi:regulator of protease activity HflC (stomatin/prohibitin superfamily)
MAGTAASLWSLVLVLLVAVLIWKIVPLKRITIFEYQKGLRYNKGRHTATLGPGQYWIWRAWTSIVPVDIRPEFITILGQDVVSADGVTLKVSLAAEFEVADAHVAVNKNANFRTSLYLTLQMALREVVGKDKIDALMENRGAIGTKLLELTKAKATEYGVRLISVDAKDLMFPGEMKKAFSQVVKAQKEGQAALERARGETAALRSLANAARMMDDNPNLLQLRALQALADSTGNTLVLGLPGGVITLGKKSDKPATMREPQEE